MGLRTHPEARVKARSEGETEEEERGPNCVTTSIDAHFDTVSHLLHRRTRIRIDANGTR